ncbi:hypothetical protein LHJ74_20045 [Streptomyces sp. N2-109]|uniref:Uncharacterized protein n=1 Tax=Streptomyces gossypii TaxID=2883101 RepID=A0ABT2JW79_9ACTN|nr:hypothetical protein [Streptomyces gossypii]MCT2592168.1 hypothetical protein [Streptomyces gossypii]
MEADASVVDAQELIRSLGATDLSLPDPHLSVLQLHCAGEWMEHDETVRAEKHFVIEVSATGTTEELVTLSTYSDPWLNKDLRGREQFDIQRANAPRLRSVLLEVTRFVGAEPDPGDPTSHATPSPTGFEDQPDEDPELLDSWGIFEVPYRLGGIISELPNSVHRYHDFAESRVSYARVVRGDTVLGYLWASDREGAAGYEPRSSVGDDALYAALHWMKNLGWAKENSLTPLQALEELANWPEDHGAGRLEGVTGSMSLDELQELSGSR